jgi:hypothetical protein
VLFVFYVKLLYKTKASTVFSSHTKSIVNAYFAQSGYMKPGINFWRSMNFESKQESRGFVNAMLAKIGEGTTEEQVAAFASLVPHDLSANVAKLWATDPKLKQFLVPKQPPAIAEQKQQLAIEGPKPPVKGANEASLSASNTVAVIPSARDPEDGGEMVDIVPRSQVKALPAPRKDRVHLKWD